MIEVYERRCLMKILVVVDMQNDFIDGALGTKEAVAIVPNVVEKIKSYDCEKIIFTRDTHEENYMETQEGKNLPVPHCIWGTKGWELNPEIEAFRKEDTIDKPSFGSMELSSYLKEQNDIESIEFVGLCTDICVISNVMITKAALPEVPVIVDAFCCAGVTPESHKNALNAMKICQVQVINE